MRTSSARSPKLLSGLSSHGATFLSVLQCPDSERYALRRCILFPSSRPSRSSRKYLRRFAVTAFTVYPLSRPAPRCILRIFHPRRRLRSFYGGGIEARVLFLSPGGYGERPTETGLTSRAGTDETSFVDVADVITSRARVRVTGWGILHSNYRHSRK